MKTLEVLFTPADFAALKNRNLSQTLCVAFDVFRATSTMVTALANGAEAIIPVAEIPEALAIKRARPEVLLAGERDGLRIQGALSGGVEFDFGNSPREFTRERVAGKTIVMTTTNGTRALRACAQADAVFIGSFLNLQATAEAVRESAPENLLLVCSGTGEQTALEDALGAGALCDLLWNYMEAGAISDSARMARELYRAAKDNVSAAAAGSKNGHRLNGLSDLRDDVAFCLRRDVFDFAADLDPAGHIKRLAP